MGSGFDVMRVRVDIVALDIAEDRWVFDVVFERELLYARFIFCRLGFLALDSVRERDFFHAEDWLVGVFGVTGVERSVGVSGGFECVLVWAKGSESRKEWVLLAEKEVVRADRLALVDVTREASLEDLRTG